MFGMSDKMLEKAKYKIKANKAYMASHGIMIDDKLIPYKDFVANSYVNPDRYIAELQHRAWSVYDYAKENDLSNLFLTLTLPTEWHQMKSFKGKLIKNKKFGGRTIITTCKHPLSGQKLFLMNTDENIDKYSPKGASIELSRLLVLLRNDRSFRSIDKDKRCYFRVTEPHKDGTPHLHISFFMPQENINSVVKSINRLFPAPQSKIELNVNSPVHYLMKYVLKTLDDLREDVDKLTALSLWYVYHGISRFYTSRSFVSLEIYRKLHGKYSLLNLTKAINEDRVTVWREVSTNNIAHIENEFGSLYVPKPIGSRFSDHKWRDDIDADEHSYFNYEFEPIKFQSHNKAPFIDVIIDGEEFILLNGVLKKPKIQPYQMSDFNLYQYFQNIDIDTVDLNHYVYTHNLMLERGLLVAEPLKASMYSDFLEVV